MVSFDERYRRLEACWQARLSKLAAILDGLWLTAIALSFLIWLAIMVDRLGFVYVTGFVALAVMSRYFSSDK